MKDAIRTWDLENDVLSWNDCVTLLFGYPLPEIGTDASWWIERIHRDDRARILLGTESVVNGGTSRWRDEYRFLRSDGEYVRVIDRGYAVRDDLGRPLRLVGAMTESGPVRSAETERRDPLRRERRRAPQLERLAAIEARFGAIPDMGSMIQLITDHARAVLGAHLAVTTVASGTSWAQAAHCSSPPEPAAPPNHEELSDRAAIYALVSGLNRPMRMTRAEMEARPPWGRSTHGHPPRGWLAVPLMGRSGENLGLIQLSEKLDGGEFTDQDETILLQLAQMASVAIEHARLYQRLKDDDRRKDEFLTTIAHELRTPLAPIRHALEVIRLAGESSPRIEGVRKLMERQVLQIVRLVDDLLDVSRITRGKVELRRERMDLALAVQSAIDASEPLVRAAGHTLTVAFPPERLYVNADLTRMAQIFSNLLNNAAKYTERGGQISLSVSVEPGWITVRVKDSGVGIPADMLDRVFDMFTQVDGAEQRAQGGLGIGLTLVRSLVGMHGGTVDAHSEGVGKGCEFVVRIPRAEDPEGRG